MSSSQSSGMGALEPAILERIFSALAPKKLAPHKRIVPLLRVNKHWHAIGLRRLYSAISIKGQWVSRPLRRTLEKNKALAALVTELVMDTELSAQDPQETLDHARVIAACPNLQHLTVLGYASADLDKYRAAVASRSSLVALNISEGSGMFTFSQLLELISGLPKLEKLIMKDGLLPSEADTSSTAGKPCSSLKMVKIIDNFDSAKRFSFPSFAALAPSISVLPQMTSLKHLDTWSQILSPHSVKHAPASVEALTYRIFPAQLLDLSETLVDPSVLPSLRALEVKGAIPPGKLTPMKFTPTAIQSIRTVCKRRRIRLT
ncbi:hypothetical protein GGX14DRAFT_461265, partial [Mycena pura]